jgi:hypothetical protein
MASMIEHGAIRLSAAVMTHPGRLTAARRLCAELAELQPVIALDTDPGRPDSVARNAQRAWAAADAKATHHLVLQDDVTPCRGFASGLFDALARRPGDALSLFTEWGSASSFAVRLAALAGRRWAPVIDPYVPTVGVVLPAHAAREFAARGASLAPQDDVGMALLLAELGVSAHVAVPNPVEHLGTESLAGNDFMGERRAALAGPWPPASADADADDLRCDIPYLATGTGRPMAALYDAGRGTWTPAPFTAFTERAGVAATEVTRLGEPGRAAVDHLRAAGLSKRAQFVLGGLRCVAFGLGFQAVRHGDGPRSSPDPTALRTAPHGALRWALTPEEIAAHLEPVTALLTESVAFGAQRAAGAMV